MGGTGTIFTLDARLSHDRESPDEKLQVRWDIDGDGTYDTVFLNDKIILHQYISPGTYNVTLQAKDEKGYISTISKAVIVINQSPNVPGNPVPTDAATNQLTNVILRWDGGDPDIEDTVTYDVYFGITINPPLVSSDQTNTSYTPDTLSPNTIYYWKVVSKDSSGDLSTSSLWYFITSPCQSTEEICDGIDNNCNEQIDEEVCTIYYKDKDNDGQGVAGDSRCLCSPDEIGKYTAIYSGDSDDLDPNVQGTIFIGNMNLPAGWSMISLLLIPDNASISSLFPGAVVIYGYEKGMGYVRVEEGENMEFGKGYWVLLEEAKTYSITGEIIDDYNLLVQDGWYMIGGCTLDAKASVDDGSIRVIYAYEKGSGYKRVQEGENLKPGKGYWILFENVTDQASLTVQGIMQ